MKIQLGFDIFINLIFLNSNICLQNTNRIEVVVYYDWQTPGRSKIFYMLDSI